MLTRVLSARRCWRVAAGLALLAFAMPGCGLLHMPGSPPTAEVKSLVVGTNKVNAVTLTMLQAQVMRFADVYAATIAQAADDFSQQAKTPEERLAGLRWKLGQSTSAYIDATGPNPLLNSLDLLVLVNLARMVIEEYAVPTFGAGRIRTQCGRTRR